MQQTHNPFKLLPTRVTKMNNEGQIGLFEAVCIATFIITTKVFYTSPGIIVKTVGTASWYATLISCAVSLLFFFLIYLLMKRFQGKNIIEIFQIVLGKFIGKLLAISFCATFSISVLCYLMAFEYTMGSENLSGMFQLSRTIYFNRFFQRLESIFLFVWVISSVISASISFYIPISIYCKTFKISNHKPLILPFAFLLFVVTILPNSLSEILEINLLFIRQYSMLFVYFVPAIVLIISLLLGKKGDKLNAKKN